MVSALIGYHSNSTWLKVAGFGLVSYTIYAVSSVDRGGMHWFSDAIAAALMSYAIGFTAGKYYRSVYNLQTSGMRASAAGGTLSMGTTPMSLGFSFYF